MSARARGAVLAVVLGASCAPPLPQPVDPPTRPAPYRLPELPLCTNGYAGLPDVRGHLQDDALVELSGVAASPSAPDLMWAHNDSGHPSLLFALGADGSARGRLQLPFDAVDLEDIAVASCPDRSGPCLYLADTGNNGGDRDDQAIYVVAEPSLPPEGVFAEGAGVARSLRIDASSRAGLPAGLDVEALAVLPDGSALLLFEKVDADLARVFALRAPFTTEAVVTGGAQADAGAPSPSSEAMAPPPGRFEEIGRVRTESPAGVPYARMVTGAALHASGRSLALRTYSGVFELRVEQMQAWLSLGERAATTVTFGPFSEPQGEAIAYDASGTGIVTISEARDAPSDEVEVHVLPCL